MWRDNSLTAAMINASCLALLNSGSVYMRGVVAAVAIGRLPDGTLVVDPGEEEECLGGSGCFAFMFAGGGLENDVTSDCVWSGWKSMSGAYDEKEFFSARELARAAALDVYFAIKQSIAGGGLGSPARNLNKITKDDERMVEDDSDDDDRMEI